MLVPEDSSARLATAVIQQGLPINAVCQHSDERALSAIHAATHCTQKGLLQAGILGR